MHNGAVPHKKITGWGEMGFVIGTLSIALGVSLMTKGNLGISMVVSPAYLLSLKIGWLSFGMADYLLQGVLLIALSLIMRRFFWKDVFSFLSAFAYGMVLDIIMLLMEDFTPASLAARTACFFSGFLINSLGVSFFFRTYLPLQVYELFVKGISDHFHKPLTRVKMCFDCGCISTAVIFSLAFFGEIRGIGPGTVICALCNGPLIGIYSRIIDKYFEFSPRISGLHRFFRRDGLEE